MFGRPITTSATLVLTIACQSGTIARSPGTNRLIELSRVGFSDDSTEALLYLAWSCLDRYGSGWKVRLLRSANGEWRVASTDLSWIE